MSLMCNTRSLNHCYVLGTYQFASGSAKYAITRFNARLRWFLCVSFFFLFCSTSSERSIPTFHVPLSLGFSVAEASPSSPSWTPTRLQCVRWVISYAIHTKFHCKGIWKIKIFIRPVPTTHLFKSQNSLFNENNLNLIKYYIKLNLNRVKSAINWD